MTDYICFKAGISFTFVVISSIHPYGLPCSCNFLYKSSLFLLIFKLSEFFPFFSAINKIFPYLIFTSLYWYSFTYFFLKLLSELTYVTPLQSKFQGIIVTLYDHCNDSIGQNNDINLSVILEYGYICTMSPRHIQSIIFHILIANSKCGHIYTDMPSVHILIAYICLLVCI